MARKRLIHIKAEPATQRTVGRRHRAGGFAMDGAGRRLEDHHRQCAALFEAAGSALEGADWRALGAQMDALRTALLEHFRHEEERLFPLYEEAIGEIGATEPLRAAHDDMRAALWVLASFSAAADPPRYGAELAALHAAFRAHAEDEEQRMYPAFERLLRAAPARG